MGRLGGLFEREVIRRWDRAALEAQTLDPVGLKALSDRSRRMARSLDRAIQAADAQLAGAPAIPRPLHTEWAWRPELWSSPVRPAGLVPVSNGTEFGREARIFHDCPEAEVSVRQSRNSTPAGAAPYGLHLDVYGFRGGFLSVAVDLPAEAIAGLSRRHIFRLGILRESERATAIYARLNVRHGPNVEQIARLLDDGDEAFADFDVATTGIDEDRVSGAWLDLIFEAPEMNRIWIGELTLSRRPRAEI